MQKKFSTIREKQVIENSQNGSGPFLQAVRGSVCALRREPKEKENRRFGRLWHPETDFSQRSFCRHPYFISKRPQRHGSVFMILLWGGGKRHPGFLKAFSIKVFEGGGKFPLILLLKPQFWRYSSAAPPFWRPIPRDPWRRCWTHQPRR